MKNSAPNKLDDMDFSADALFSDEEKQIAQNVVQAPVPTVRVKANRWFAPSRLAKDGKTPIFPAQQLVATWFGANRILRSFLQKYPETELAVPMDKETQNLFYKSTIGVLAVGSEVQLVRLETLNADGEVSALTIQYAVVDTRKNHGENQVRFR